MDAAPFIIEQIRPGNPTGEKDFGLLSDLRQHVSWRRGDAVILAEANVDPPALADYFTDAGGSHSRLHMLFDFILNGALMLALAREDAEPIIGALRDTPQLPKTAQWAVFLRNHDENDLSRLTAEQRDDVFAAFGPEPEMQLYGRGIRRRLAPMLGNDRRRLELAYSLQFTLRGTPVLRYGAEIGMGDDLSLPERDPLRTPMQWSDRPNGGFSGAPDDRLIRPVIDSGEFGYQRVNVTAQRMDPDSLLSWFERMIRTLRECPEVGTGSCTVLDVKLPRHVLAHRADSPIGSAVFLHNLWDEAVTVDLGKQPGAVGDPVEMFADGQYDPPGTDLCGLDLAGHGYRWIRIRRAAGA